MIHAMIHPATELRRVNATIGFGVFATEPIPRGTITWVRCALDRAFTAAEQAALAAPYLRVLDKYCFTDGRGLSVLCWDHGRFMNHSCAATCLSPGFDIDVAVRDIAIGEELTCDYAMLNTEEPFPCSCGEPGCRRTILPDDWDTYVPAWDAHVAAARTDGSLAQPLAELLVDPDRVLDALAGRTPMPSCRVHRYVRS